MITLFNETKSFDYMNSLIGSVMKAKVTLLRNGFLSASGLKQFIDMIPKDKYNILNISEGQDTLIYLQSNHQDANLISRDILSAFITFLSLNSATIQQVLKDDQFTLSNLLENTTFPGFMYSIECFPGSQFVIRF
jgi:hypothetical protein